MSIRKPARLVGAIEAGGTKFQCAVASGIDDILESTRVETSDPQTTLRTVIEFFEAMQSKLGAVHAFGVASFGPINLKRESPTFGHLLPTPKAGWTGTDLITPLAQRFMRPVCIDTDVNAAALAEWALAGAGVTSLAYVTVGTGIGGGAVIRGQPLHGLMHPEMGHIAVKRDIRDSQFVGNCPFHGDCLEGLACGPAIQARWGKPLDKLPETHAASSIIGGYLAQLAVDIALVISCERIVFGGGVMSNGSVLPHVRAGVNRQLNGYLAAAGVAGTLEHYITAPRGGDRSGLIGAILLALNAVARDPAT